MRKELHLQLLRELLKNSRRSDRELAKILGVSQPTITRKRRELERELSLRYTCIPDFRKLHLELLAITFANWNPGVYDSVSDKEAFRKKVLEFRDKHKNLIFASDGSGAGFSRVAISFHTDYTDYVNFIKELQTQWGAIFQTLNSFIVPLTSEKLIKLFDFSGLGAYIYLDK